MDIAKVLAMEECEQLKWAKEEGLISDKDYKYYLEGGIPTKMILADLAFRLRGDLRKKNISKAAWRRALLEVVYAYFNKGTKYKITDYKLWRWVASDAKPIHWILAVLKAKENSNEQ